MSTKAFSPPPPTLVFNEKFSVVAFKGISNKWQFGKVVRFKYIIVCALCTYVIVET